AVGVLSANVALGLESVALAGTNLANKTLTAGAIAVSGTVYDVATATHDATFALGDLRKGATRGLAVTNTVLAGGSATYQDSLDVAGSTASTALATGSSINVLAGATGQFNVTTLVAGALSANVTFTRTSNANGLAGLANSSLGTSAATVTGAVYDLANPSYAATQALGNLRVGVTARTVDVTNATITSASYQDKLAVRATGAAALTLTNPADIAAGATSAVGVVAASAGSLAGNLTLGFTSKALAGTTLADAALAGGSVALTGAAYDYAQPTIASTLSLGNRRVGTSASLLVTNTTRTAAAYQDSLDAVASTTVGTLSLANPANILAGKSGNVTVTAATAGSLAGDVTFALTSNANGVTGLDATTALTGQTVAVTGAAYDLAKPTYATALALNNLRRGVTTNFAVANTTVTDAAYQDKLVVAASTAGSALTLSSPAAIAAGASGNVGVTAAGAGSLAGSITLGLTSDANGVSGLANAALAAGTVTVTGFAYDQATATLAGTTVAFGNVRTGAARTLGVTNTLAAGGVAAYQDSLDVTATTALATLALANPANLRATQSGDIALTATRAGSLAGDVAVALRSNANGVSGLANIDLAGRTVTVTGAAYDLANASYASTLSLGNRRVGYSVDVAIANAVRANGAAAYQDSLDLTVTKNNANLTLAGATANIAAAGSANVGVTASSAGSLAATLSLGLISNANGVTDLVNVTQAGGAIAVTGAAYDLAQATFGGSTVAFGNVRTGAAASVALTNTTRTNAAYQDSLDAVASTTVGTLAVASPANLAAGSTGYVGVTAAKAGSLAGNVAVALTSNANGVLNLSNASLGTTNLAVTGAAYDYAAATVAASLSLGNLRVGATTNLGVTNTLAANGAAAYQDKLAVAGASANANLTFVNPADIAATESGNVTLRAAYAGSLAGTATLTLTSKALAGTGLSDLALAAKNVALTGAAYDYASPSYAATMDLGNIRKGGAVTRSVANAVLTSAAYQDNLL
ncbi:hypothetical protein EBR16_03860, partial [bacterium]|nr:hypothetical protein [bacterium]